jgi:hypothetical protein
MDTTTLVVNQLTLGAIASWVLQALKNASWFPWLKQEGTDTANKIAALITSLLAVTGLTYVYDPTAHTLLIQNFSLALVANAVWHWLTQYVMQQGWYEAVFNRVKPTPAQLVQQKSIPPDAVSPAATSLVGAPPAVVAEIPAVIDKKTPLPPKGK